MCQIVYKGQGKLGGARSRDYDYLRGLGYLHKHLWLEGWIESEPSHGASVLYNVLGTWHPPARLRDLNRSQAPRVVSQRWGINTVNSRTHFVLQDVSLSTAGANYGPMDLPLTVDFAGAPDSLRVYFLPDARRDPYGKKKIEAGPHHKTLHLRPFWAGTQRRGDALGLVVYRARDLEQPPPTLESHLVLPLALDGIWLGDREISMEPGRPLALPIEEHHSVVLRKGSAAAAVRVVWSRGLEASAAPVALVHDANPHGACRITVAHHSFWGIEAPEALPGAAFWLRVVGGLETEAAFEQWRRRFAEGIVRVDADSEKISVSVEGDDGPLRLAATRPFTGPVEVDPPPGTGILELDGEDLGRRILERLPSVRDVQKKLDQMQVIQLQPGQSASWEAEEAHIVPGMVVAEDDKAFGSRFVWVPGAPGERGGSPAARATWKLRVAEAGTFYLWARVRAPTPDDDSFFVRIHGDASEPVPLTDWHTGTHQDWEWTPVSFGRTSVAAPLQLPAGDLRLEFRCREDGAMLDRLFVTASADEQPQ